MINFDSNIKNISQIIYDLNSKKTKPTFDNSKDVLEMLMPRDDDGNMLSHYSMQQKSVF